MSPSAESPRSSETLDADREHLRMMIEAAPNAIVVSDDRGRVTLVNKQLEQLLGYDRAELLDRSVERLVPQKYRGSHPVLRDTYLQAPSARPMGAGRDLFALHKDGTEIPVEIGLAPISSPRGNFVLASIVDIRERRQIEQLRLVSVGERRRRLDAEADRDRARDASDVKSQFVATMSHELRTPLNAIIGMAELLDASMLDERQRGYVRRVNESAEALLAVINSILEFSKIDAGKLELEARDFELETVVGSAGDVLSQEARRKGIALHAYVDPLIPSVLCGDPDRLRQVLLNLIGNAVKFTEHGRIVVRALPQATTAQNTLVRFEVQDTGIGISPETIPKLFEPFVQGDGSAGRAHGGTGLGLSIVKRIVEAMGGEVGVTSGLGAGSTFWFTVRFARPRAVGSTPRILSAGVLVFSEDDTFTEIVTRYATAWGMTARRVASAQAARSAIDVRSAHATRGWVAIIDGSGQRGAAVAAELRALRAFDALPTIVVGPDERLSEPLRASELFDAIVDALAGSDASTSNRTLEHEARQPPRGRVLVAEDNVTMHEVLVHQFDALGVGLKIVSDGAQAVAEVRRDPYDLVLMDCQMPKVDGFEATRLIREDERVTGRHVPIVAMTANAFKEDRDACLAAGMDDYLAKPVRMETLRATLDRWLQRKAD